MARTHMTFRVDPKVPQRIDSLAASLGATSTSDGARRLLDLGIQVAEAKLPPPSQAAPDSGEVEQQAEALLAHSVATAFAMLDVLARVRPMGAIVTAFELSGQAVAYADATAKANGTTLADLVGSSVASTAAYVDGTES